MIRKMIEIMGLESQSGPCMNYLNLINKIYNLVGKFDFLRSFILLENIKLVESVEIISFSSELNKALVCILPCCL